MIWHDARQGKHNKRNAYKDVYELLFTHKTESRLQWGIPGMMGTYKDNIHVADHSHAKHIYKGSANTKKRLDNTGKSPSK